MKILGDDVYIQRGENWSLDFDITNEAGEPYMMLKEWQNPFLVITITAARYSQEGDYRHSWWLDLTQRYVEDAEGKLVLEPVKRFTGTEALFLDADDFSITEVMAAYGPEANPTPGRIVTDKDSDFDVTNFLFYIDPNKDGNRTYKYCKSYTIVPETFVNCKIPVTVNPNAATGEGISTAGFYITASASAGHVYYYNSAYPTGAQVIDCGNFTIHNDSELYILVTARTFPIQATYGYGTLYVNADYNLQLYTISATPSGIGISIAVAPALYTNNIEEEHTEDEDWEEYSLRVVKTFDTKEWVEQGYLYDIKVLAGELVEESVHDYLINEGKEVPDLPWSDEELQEQIERIDNAEMRAYYQGIYDTGMPLMPTYDTKLLVLMPTNLYVSANIQKGI